MMRMEEIIRRKKPGRKVEGIAAALLPFETDDELPWRVFRIICGRRSGPD